MPSTAEQCVAEDKFVDSKEKAVKDTTHERSLQPTTRIKIISFYIMEDDWFTAISGKGTEIEFKCVTGSFVSGQIFFSKIDKKKFHFLWNWLTTKRERNASARALSATGSITPFQPPAEHRSYYI